MTSIFRRKVGHRRRVGIGYREILGPDIFVEISQIGTIPVSHAARQPCGIIKARRVVRRFVPGVVDRFVYPAAPGQNARMVSIAHDHVDEILHLRGFPCCISKVIPSGDFLEDKQPDFIAAVKKIGRLYIMRGPDRITTQIVFKDVRVFPLEPFRGRAPEVGECFMPVQAPELQGLAVEIAFPVGFADSKGTDAHPRLEFVNICRTVHDLNVYRI